MSKADKPENNCRGDKQERCVQFGEAASSRDDSIFENPGPAENKLRDWRRGEKRDRFGSLGGCAAQHPRGTLGTSSCLRHQFIRELWDRTGKIGPTKWRKNWVSQSLVSRVWTRSIGALKRLRAEGLGDCVDSTPSSERPQAWHGMACGK